MGQAHERLNTVAGVYAPHRRSSAAVCVYLRRIGAAAAAPAAAVHASAAVRCFDASAEGRVCKQQAEGGVLNRPAIVMLFTDC